MKEKPLLKEKLQLQSLQSLGGSSYRKVSCPSCDHEVPATDINIQDQIAKCGECDVVFPIHHLTKDFSARTKSKQEVIRPEGIDIFRFRGDLELVTNQPLNIADILLVSMMPMFAGLLSWLTFTESFSFLFPAIAVWMLIFYVTYNLANRSKHKIHVEIDEAYLTLKWRPRRMHKDQRYAVREIDQVYVKQVPNAHYFSVYAIVNGVEGQKHVRLIPNMSSKSKALYLEQEIEAQLGIPDRQVPEESL